MDLTCQHIASMHASMIAMSTKVVGHTTFSSRGVLHVSLSRTHGGFLKSSILSYYSEITFNYFISLVEASVARDKTLCSHVSCSMDNIIMILALP
jgi:hypothetical protein